jgi:hypothetical protein
VERAKRSRQAQAVRMLTLLTAGGEKGSIPAAFRGQLTSSWMVICEFRTLRNLLTTIHKVSGRHSSTFPPISYSENIKHPITHRGF